MATINTRLIFGLGSEVSNNVHYLDENTVAYPAASVVVVCKTDVKSQMFIPLTPECKGVTAMAITPDRKFMAVAEGGEESPTISIIDVQTLRKRKGLQSRLVESNMYASMAFSPDGKTLAAVGGHPEWHLVIWQWEKSKVLATIKCSNTERSPIHSVAFNLLDPSVITVVGERILKGFRLSDGQLKHLPPFLGKHREPGNCLCQCWMPDFDKEKLVVGTDSGELMYFEGGEHKLNLPPVESRQNSVECIVPYSKGFIVGSDRGLVTLYEKLDDAPFYRTGKTFTIFEHEARVTSISINSIEEALVCALATRQMFTLPLVQADILKPEDNNFDYLSHPFHAGPITGLDTCVRKQMIATCSTDMSVRIWNTKEMGCDLAKYFDDEAYSVSLHPSGLHVLVGFADKVRLMNVLDGDIRPYAEFNIKLCREVRFSTGGQYFAAVSNNVIQLYNTYTCEPVGNLHGHGLRVRSLQWSADDLFLHSCGLDGAVYTWSVKELKRIREAMQKGCQYSCVTAVGDEKDGRIFAVGDDCKIKEYVDPLTISKELDTGVEITHVVLSSNQRHLFAATVAGQLRMYKYPFTGEFQELQAHVRPISRMCISTDDTYIFTVSEDGTLAVHTIRDKEGRKEAKEKGSTVPWGEEVLVSKAEHEEAKSHMQDLESQVGQLGKQVEMQLHLKELEAKARIEELKEGFAKERHADAAKYAELERQRIAEGLDWERKLEDQQMEQDRLLTEMEAKFQQKIMNELERYSALIKDKEALNLTWDEQNSRLMDTHEHVITELTMEYEAKLGNVDIKLTDAMSEKVQQLRAFEETKTQLEEDADREIDKLKEKYEAMLRVEHDIGLRLKGENGIMRKKFNALKRDIKSQEDDIAALNEQKANLNLTIQNLENEMGSLRKEIAARDETIGDKERRIVDMKKKTMELEKFKFILDFKVAELRKQIEPKERDVVTMREQLQSMGDELQRYQNSTTALEIKNRDMKQRMEGMQRAMASLHTVNHDLTAHLSQVNSLVANMSNAIQDPKALKEAAKVLYEATVGDELRKNDVSREIEEENKKQREYLERAVANLKRKAAKDAEINKEQSRRILQDNITLMKEVNELRRNNKVLMQEKDKTRTVMMNLGLNLDGTPTRAGPRNGGAAGAAGGGAEGGSPGARSDSSRQGTAKSTRRSLDTRGSAGSLGRERPMAQMFGPAPRWGEPRMPPRPFQGYDREADKDQEIKRLTAMLMEMEDRLAHYEMPRDDSTRLPPVVNTTTL